MTFKSVMFRSAKAKLVLVSVLASLLFFAFASPNSWAQKAAPAPTPADSSDLGCPFKAVSDETASLQTRAESSLAQLEASHKGCDSIDKAVQGLKASLDTLSKVQVSQPEAALEISFQTALRRYKRGLPVDSPGSAPYLNCVNLYPGDSAKVENCMVEQYAMQIQQLHDDNELKQQQAMQVQQQQLIAENVTRMSTQISELVNSTSRDPACRNDPIVVSAVLGTVTHLSNYMAGSFPGTSYFGVGVAGSLSALSALVSDLLSDKTVERLLQGMKDEREFANYACLYMAVQDKVLGCSNMSGPAIHPIHHGPGLYPKEKPYIEEILGSEIPNPHDLTQNMKLMDYLNVVKADIKRDTDAQATDMKARPKREFLNTQNQYIDSIEALQKAYADVKGGELDPDSAEGKIKYPALEAAQKKFNDLFAKQLAPDAPGWAFYPKNYNDVLNLRGLLALHKKTLSQLNDTTQIGALEWYMDSTQKARQAYFNFFQKMKTAAKQDIDVAPLGKINTSMVIAFKDTFVTELQDSEQLVRNACRAGEFGAMLPLIRLCTLTAGMYYFDGDKHHVSPNGLFSENSIDASKDYVRICSQLRCPNGLPWPQVKKEYPLEGSRDEIKRYVCKLNAGYDHIVAGLKDEFQQKGTICGRPICDISEEIRKRGH
jgi:hypothetical protein